MLGWGLDILVWAERTGKGDTGCCRVWSITSEKNLSDGEKGEVKIKAGR